jgi:hypothetical protein
MKNKFIMGVMLGTVGTTILLKKEKYSKIFDKLKKQ